MTTADTIPPYTGVFPIAPTPFNEDESLDLSGQQRVLDCMIDQGVDGLCILAKQAASSTNVLAEGGTDIAALLWLCGVGLGFVTYGKYYNICTRPDLSQTAKSIEVFMYFWLTVAGSITAGTALVGVATVIRRFLVQS